MNTLVLVDGPNLVADVGRYLSTASKSNTSTAIQSLYYETWFDVDRLVRATLGVFFPIGVRDDLGIVLVHSRKSLGDKTSPCWIDGPMVLDFWARQGANESTSTLLVDIQSGQAEKGIDTTIVVYLFETLESWGAAVLFTNDADFVPPVLSLRRKGKRVYCAAHLAQHQRGPLVSACQHFFPLEVVFLDADRATFEALLPDGPIDRFLASDPSAWTRLNVGLEIHCSQSFGPTEVNSHLNAAGLERYVEAVGGAGVMTVYPKAPPDPSGNLKSLLCEGIRRHIDVHANATWRKLLRP